MDITLYELVSSNLNAQDTKGNAIIVEHERRYHNLAGQLAGQLKYDLIMV